MQAQVESMEVWAYFLFLPVRQSFMNDEPFYLIFFFSYLIVQHMPKLVSMFIFIWLVKLLNEGLTAEMIQSWCLVYTYIYIIYSGECTKLVRVVCIHN